MANLVRLEALGRKIRWDALPDLGTPTWNLAEQAIRAGNIESGLELFDYARSEVVTMHDTEAVMIAAALDYVAETLGEDQVEQLWRFVGRRTAQSLTSNVGSAVEDAMRLQAEFQRGHSTGRSGLGDLIFEEQPDRYVLTLDPCGSGGKLRRSGRFGVTRKPHPWSWGKAGVPYYCTHCCIFWEIGPARKTGFPRRVHENVDNPQAPCVLLYYKKPELIPDRYFSRIGMEKKSPR